MPIYRGTPGRDFMRGSVLNDIFYAYGGDDVVYANSGNDTAYGGTGRDVLHGQAGDDTLYGEIGADVLYGGLGNDVLDGGADNDRMYGGKNNDTYHVRDAGDQVVELVGEGTDTIHLYLDQFKLNRRTYTIPDNVENLRTSGGSSELIFGNDLNNFISLGDGSKSNPRFTVRAGGGRDIVLGNDQVNGRDVLMGDGGNDRLIGNKGNDTLYGGSEHDVLFGSQGNDILRGGSGNDRLNGGRENDYLVGYDGSNRANTVSRNDRDILTGGHGKDTFELALHSDGSANKNPYAYGPGYAIITDFNRKEDRIRLTLNGNMDGFRLGTGDYDGDGRQDTGIFYSRFGINSALIGVVSNNTGLSLDDPYFY